MDLPLGRRLSQISMGWRSSSLHRSLPKRRYPWLCQRDNFDRWEMFGYQSDVVTHTEIRRDSLFITVRRRLNFTKAIWKLTGTMNCNVSLTNNPAFSARLLSNPRLASRPLHSIRTLTSNHHSSPISSPIQKQLTQYQPPDPQSQNHETQTAPTAPKSALLYPSDRTQSQSN
jgi:hypothetical protein